MRILFLTQFFQPEPMFKGLPFVKALMARGHTVEVLTGFPNYPGGKLYPGYRVRCFQEERIEGIRVVRVPLYPSHDRSGVRRIANYLSFGASAALLGPWLVNRPDVIYVYNLVTLSPAWRLLRQRFGCPVVLDVQDLWPESVTMSGMLRNRALNRLLKAGCSRAYRSADRIVAQSPGFSRHLKALGFPAEQMDLIYNWCEEGSVDLTSEEMRRIRTENGFANRFNVLFAGTMGKAQALDCVIDAARSIATQAPEVMFTLLGGGIEVERLKERAAGLKNVQFLARCPAAQAARIAAASDALLVHLKRDPLFSITIPSKTQAYFHAGKPILMGVEGDAAYLVQEAKGGFCFEAENAASSSSHCANVAPARSASGYPPPKRALISNTPASPCSFTIAWKHSGPRAPRNAAAIFFAASASAGTRSVRPLLTSPPRVSIRQ